MNIEIIRSKISRDYLNQLVKENYGDMIKGVVDLGRQIIALGGELHADAEEILLEDGSRQEFLWGFNIFPSRPSAEKIEYVSMINVRPKQNNFTPTIRDLKLQEQIKNLIEKLVEGLWTETAGTN